MNTINTMLGIDSDDNACCSEYAYEEVVRNAAVSGFQVALCVREHFCLFSMRRSPESTSHHTSTQTLLHIYPLFHLTGTHIPQQIYTAFQKHLRNTQKPSYARRQLLGLAPLRKALQTASIRHLGNRSRSRSSSNILINFLIPRRAKSG